MTDQNCTPNTEYTNQWNQTSRNALSGMHPDYIALSSLWTRLDKKDRDYFTAIGMLPRDALR